MAVNNGSALALGRSPHGERGLKWTRISICQIVHRSLSSWRAWIEITPSIRFKWVSKVSLSSWRAWIEIHVRLASRWKRHRSLSSWRAWIEIQTAPWPSMDCRWSLSSWRAWIEISGVVVRLSAGRSLSSWRAWIEIPIFWFSWSTAWCRSPHGER